LMLVTGAEKRDALRASMLGEIDPMKHPAQIATRPGRNVVWFLDQAVAAALES